VCKQRGLGVNFHHIDENNSNTTDPNLAVLCVMDHDAHHRPTKYTDVNHVELGKRRIGQFKKSWEVFVAEARKPNPQILAVINVYGNRAAIHSMKLVLQWANEKIEFERVYHLLDGPIEVWLDRAMEEIQWLGKGIQVSVINKPLNVEYCPSCGSATSRTVQAGWARKLTAKNWAADSICSIYVNPTTPSLAILISLKNEVLYQGHLHRCGNDLHYVCNEFDERIPIRNKAKVRQQATRIVQKLVDQWQPAHVFLGTGDPDAPTLIRRFVLPVYWKKRTPFSSASRMGRTSFS
jgi:hypothetical protein